MIIKIQDFNTITENSSKPRKTFPTLSVQEGAFVFGDYDETGQYGASGKCRIVGLDPVEGVENPETDNCQYVSFNFNFGGDLDKAMNKAYSKALIPIKNLLGEKAVKTFNDKVVEGGEDLTPEELFDLIKDTLDGKELACIISSRKELGDNGKPADYAMISSNKTWCRTIKEKAELQEALDADTDQYTWDRTGGVVTEDTDAETSEDNNAW